MSEDRRKMSATRKVKLIYFALMITSPIDARIQVNGESSGEYLQKVMGQLQEFNLPSSVNVYEKISANNNYNNAAQSNKGKQSHAVQRINMNGWQNVRHYRNQSLGDFSDSNNRKVDLRRVDAESNPQYNQFQNSAVTKVKQPESVGYTRAELATMYKNALEMGSKISMPMLTNAISTGAVAHVADGHVEFPVKEPLYRYYFFPLKTFASELKKDHGYQTIPASAFDNTEAAQTTQTQLSNPLFVAISTFVATAIVFMMSVLFLPKLPQFDILHSRAMQDDFFHLSNILVNAVDHYNLLETFKDRVESIR